MMKMRQDEEKLRHAIFSWDVLGNCAEEGAVSAYGSCLLLSVCRSFLLANIPTAVLVTSHLPIWTNYLLPILDLRAIIFPSSKNKDRDMQPISGRL